MRGNLLSRCFRSSGATLPLLLWSCAAFSLTTANFVPLAPGNTWTYSVVENGVSSSETRTVSANKVIFNGTEVYEIVHSDGQKSYELNDSAGYREFGTVIPNVFVDGYGYTSVTATISPPAAHAPAAFDVGQTYSGSGTVTYTYQGLGTLSGPISYSTTAVAFENVSVPAGSFYALKVESQISMTLTSPTGAAATQTSTQIFWLAENVGRVKSTYSDSGGQTESMELVSYSVAQPATTTTSTTTTTTAATTSTAAAVTTTTTTAPTSTTTTQATTTTTIAGTGTALNFAAGWNLLGNGTSGSLDVASAFGDSGAVNTVWKWVASRTGWAFYTPTLADGGAGYAAGKGYELLTSINSGEGFWVNAKAAFAAQLPAGTAISSASFRNMASGWNLIATGDSPTASEFNKTLSLAAPAAGEIPINLTTLWAWDSARGNWYFYAPSLEKSGGLSAYIQSKNYLDFGAKTLDPTIGFWVNKPATQAVLQSISVTPANQTIGAGSSQQFAAAGTYSDGSSADISASVTWSSAAPAVATITGSGLATGVAAGSSTITAESGAVSGSALLTVADAAIPAACNAIAYPANDTGGCHIRLAQPLSCQAITLPFSFEWTTDGSYCETPFTLYITGDPPLQRLFYWQLSENISQGITHTGGIVTITAEDLVNAGVTSASGVYYWNVIGYYGSHPESQAFRIK